MRRVLAVLTLWCLAGPAVADPTGVRLQPTPEGVRVDYRLAAPASRFVFDTPLSAGAQVFAVSVGLMDGDALREVSAPCSRAAPPPPPAYDIPSIP